MRASYVDAGDKVVPENDPSRATLSVTLPSGDTELEQLKSRVELSQNKLEDLLKDLGASGPNYFANQIEVVNRQTIPGAKYGDPEPIIKTSEYEAHGFNCPSGYYVNSLTFHTNNSGLITAQVGCSKLIRTESLISRRP